MFHAQIKVWFEEAVRLNTDCPEELKRKLLAFDHPLIVRFFGKMNEQFVEAERLCRLRRLPLKIETLKLAMYDMTGMFILGLKGRAKLMYESDLAKAARVAEADKIKEFESVLAGNPIGEFAEAGVISDEKIDRAREAQLEAEDRRRQVKPV